MRNGLIQWTWKILGAPGRTRELRRWLATSRRITDFLSVAEDSVGAFSVLWRVLDGVGHLVTGIQSTFDFVIEIGYWALATTVREITLLFTVAELLIIAESVIGGIDNLLTRLVAGIDRTGHTVIQSQRCRDTALTFHAGFFTIAIQAITAESVIRCVDNLVVDFIAIVICTGQAIVNLRQRTVLAQPCAAITEFNAVTEEAIRAWLCQTLTTTSNTLIAGTTCIAIITVGAFINGLAYTRSCIPGRGLTRGL